MVDINDLTTNRAPDIEPHVAPSRYVNYRYTDNRGKSNRALIEAQKRIRSNQEHQMFEFEKKLMKQQEKYKSMQKRLKEQTKEIDEKLKTRRDKFMETFKNQKNMQEDNLARSDKLFREGRDFALKRLRDRSASDNSKSYQHYKDQQIGRERRVATAKKNWDANEKRVNEGIKSFKDKLVVHNNRASSARSEKIELNKRNRMKWEETVQG